MSKIMLASKSKNRLEMGVDRIFYETGTTNFEILNDQSNEIIEPEENFKGLALIEIPA